MNRLGSKRLFHCFLVGLLAFAGGAIGCGSKAVPTPVATGRVPGGGHRPGAGPAGPIEKPFAEQIDVKLGDVAKGEVLDVPFILWGGDVATFYANGGLETKPGTIFNKQGLNFKLIPGDDFAAQVKNYLSGKSPFLRGTVSMLAQASEVLGKDPRTQPVVFLQLTWSAGDHLVARGDCKTLADLNGKKIALQRGGPHVGMLGDILRTARLKWTDITVVWTDDVTGDKGPSALFKKDPSIDACFAITPDMQGLTGGLDDTGTGEKDTVKGAHVLVSTAHMSRSIADVYACRKDFFDAHKDLVEKFAAGYLKGCEELIDLKKRSEKKEEAAAAKYKAILKLTQDIYGKDAIKEEADADGLISDAVFVGIPGNISFFTDATNLTNFEGKAKVALDVAQEIGSIATRAEFLKANFDYDHLTKLGQLTGKALPEDRFRNVDVKILPENTIYYFTISFEPNQSDFPEAEYGEDFQRALEQAALFGNAVVAVRGHADPSNLVNGFMKYGVEAKVLTQRGNAYFLKDGTGLDPLNTKKMVEMIEKEHFVGSHNAELLDAINYLQQLSEQRAKSVRRSLESYAHNHKIRLDKSQIKEVGVGVLEPIGILTPQSVEDDAQKNRRVEFRIIKVPGLEAGGSDFDI
jgi:ABC-type nitrate/sulfonate/bicarbonate transport system substrate-binding protein